MTAAAFEAPAIPTADAWRERLRSDASALERSVAGHLGDLHAAIVHRAHAAGASSLVLTGSTARGQRTDISDLDYHLFGKAIDVRDLSHELDLHVPERSCGREEDPGRRRLHPVVTSLWPCRVRSRSDPTRRRAHGPTPAMAGCCPQGTARGQVDGVGWTVRCEWRPGGCAHSGAHRAVARGASVPALHRRLSAVASRGADSAEHRRLVRCRRGPGVHHSRRSRP